MPVDHNVGWRSGSEFAIKWIERGICINAGKTIWDEPLLDGGGREGLIDTIGKHMRGHLASHSQLGDVSVIAGIILLLLRFNTRTLE